MSFLRLFPVVAFIITLSYGFMDDARWTSDEINKANTAKNTSYMDSTERAIVFYCNLARMYPKLFSQLEVKDYYGTTENPDEYKNSANRRSLMRELESMEPVPPLQPDSVMALLADCFQKELEKSGEVGHDRKKCSDDYMAENCSFGKVTARDVVLQLLIDEGVPSLGHRKNILSKEYTRLGVAFGDHKKYRKCAVMDFK